MVNNTILHFLSGLSSFITALVSIQEIKYIVEWIIFDSGFNNFEISSLMNDDFKNFKILLNQQY